MRHRYRLPPGVILRERPRATLIRADAWTLPKDLWPATAPNPDGSVWSSDTDPSGAAGYPCRRGFRLRRLQDDSGKDDGECGTDTVSPPAVILRERPRATPIRTEAWTL